jgi:hypothetical protein
LIGEVDQHDRGAEGVRLPRGSAGQHTGPGREVVTAENDVDRFRPWPGDLLEPAGARGDRLGAGPGVRPPLHAVMQQRDDPARALLAQVAGAHDDVLLPLRVGRRRLGEAMTVRVRQADDPDGAGRGVDHRRRRQPDVHVCAQQRERQSPCGVEQRLDSVVELVVTGCGRRDRQVRHIRPRPLAEEGVRRVADDEIADVQPDRRLALALALQQLDDARQRAAHPVAGRQWDRGRAEVGGGEESQPGPGQRRRKGRHARLSAVDALRISARMLRRIISSAAPPSSGSIGATASSGTLTEKWRT